MNGWDRPRPCLWGVRGPVWEGRWNQMMNWPSQNASTQGKGNGKHQMLSITWISPRRCRGRAVNKPLKGCLRWLYLREWQKAALGSPDPRAWVLGADGGQASRREGHQLPQQQGLPRSWAHVTYPSGTSRNFQEHLTRVWGFVKGEEGNKSVQSELVLLTWPHPYPKASEVRGNSESNSKEGKKGPQEGEK